LKPALVIIDSLTTHKPSKCDLNAHGDVAPMLVALRKLAAKYGCAIVCIHHTNKAQTSDPLAKIGGSIGISATARHVILVGKHPEDANLRVAAIAKTNLVKPDAPGYIFSLDPFAWRGTTQLRASDLLHKPVTTRVARAMQRCSYAMLWQEDGKIQPSLPGEQRATTVSNAGHSSARPIGSVP
jgi:hypothetical protein